ncbi:hypothetical protein ACQPYK_43185 [Streptosporangium sp. CA-135522]|uniref:hypothetical protein n=1 Tax=Streptosporangium sp. CA-135522 TaxID=3240072 RepID=UPI003D94A9C9
MGARRHGLVAVPAEHPHLVAGVAQERRHQPSEGPRTAVTRMDDGMAAPNSFRSGSRTPGHIHSIPRVYCYDPA